jgi:hypothetical protein
LEEAEALVSENITEEQLMWNKTSLHLDCDIYWWNIIALIGKRSTKRWPERKIIKEMYIPDTVTYG